MRFLSVQLFATIAIALASDFLPPGSPTRMKWKPSGYPLPYAAMPFRQDLNGIERAFPNHKRIVLIGHSMGGMICRLTGARF